MQIPKLHDTGFAAGGDQVCRAWAEGHGIDAVLRISDELAFRAGFQFNATDDMFASCCGNGSTVEKMCEALGWQAHTLRAALTRLPGGAKAERTREDGVTSYKLA